MSDIVSRNTIKLANSASAVADFYVGYVIFLSRFDAVTGKKLVQSRDIIAYDGTAKIATIDGIWDADFIPGPTDTYKIVPKYPDSRVTINPAMQTMDYISSNRYGKSMDPLKDLYLPSWLESARICDTQSDVTIKTTADLTGLAVGAIYRRTSAGTGRILFQGEVKSWKPGYVRFTKVLGKLSNKWNSWKFYQQDELVYNETKLYKAASAGTISSAPVHTVDTVGNATIITATALQKASGSGPASLALPIDGNPVQDVNERGVKISGYSLYDADGIDYWRYLGWDEHSQRYATRHQTNLEIDTSAPLFDNINSLMEHYGGILRYTAGKYHLDIEEAEGVISNNEDEVRNITTNDIIGRIRVSDEGIRRSFNSLTVAYADPANKFEAKNISFFNSEFLKIDRSIPKKGNVSIPGITNFYNARMLADKFLVKSRYGLTVSLNLAPAGLLLMAGKVIQLQHPKYNWVNKRFRITNLTHNADATVDIVAEEYDDKFYLISNISRPPAAALAAEASRSTDIQPGGLYATSISNEDETVGGIELSWNNSPGVDSTVETEIFGSFNSNLFIIVTDVGSDAFGVASGHGLLVGDTITSQFGTNGLEFGKTYYVVEVPNANNFRISETEGGPVKTLVSGTGLNLRFLTANIITTVSPPTNSYIDVIPGQGSERIQKYYWIRHRINTQ